MKFCRYCTAPIVLTGPAGWGSLSLLSPSYYPDPHCPVAPRGSHRVFVLADLLIDIASVYGDLGDR